jgi:hypothetical protein
VEPGVGGHPGGGTVRTNPFGRNTLIWVVLVMVVFVPLAVRLYQRAASR